MNPYPLYKDSGVEWIGEIPSDWRVTKHKYNLDILSGYPFNSKLFSNENGFPLIRIRDITSGLLNTFYEGDYSDEYIVQTGDLLIGMDGDFNVRWWNNELGLLNQRCCSIKESSNLNRKWLFYLLPNELKIINDLTYFTTVKHLSNNDIYDSKTILPPIETQKQIVSFLDNKTQKIDELIEKTEKKIDLLKEKRTSLINHCVTKGLNPNVEMKDSGVEWIGEIPNYWDKSQFKYFIKLRHGHQFRDNDFTDSGVKIIKITQLDKKGFLNISNCSKVDEKRLGGFEDILIKENDILMCLTGGTIGKIIKVGKVDEPLLQNYRVGHFSPLDSEIMGNDYMFYLMNSEVIVGQIFFDVRETGQPNIGMEDMNRMRICIPPIEEQTQIVSFLDEQTQKIDTTIEKETQRIELLKEYRQSLISELVTGKIDVRDWKE